MSQLKVLFMCEALHWILIPARKKEKDTKTQTNRKPQNTTGYSNPKQETEEVHPALQNECRV